MAPKKGQKMSLNAFLEDSALGSWADEMDALPSAPAPKLDDGDGRDYRGRGDDFLSSRPDRAPMAPREEVPLPTQPPFTAFVGNLAFDLTEGDLGAFFGSSDVVKSAKIIRDRDDKPKGFGYVEFTNVNGLKDALSKNGTTFSSRAIRVNIAEPPKERAGGFGNFDDDKFASPWRRDGPLPDQGRDGGSRRRYEGLPSENRESISEGNNDWRSNRPPPRFPTEAEAPPVRRRGSGFSTPTQDGEASPADAEEKWTIGGRFKPSQSSGTDSQPGSRFGSMRGRGDMGPPSSVAEEGPWRRARPAGSSTSPTSSVPPTPQLARRKLELLPRSTSGSSQPTPLSSPKSAGFSSVKANPFGAAKPVDVSAREAAAVEKIEKEEEKIRERVAHDSMSRQTSRQARERPGHGRSEARSPSSTPATAAEEIKPGSPRTSNTSSQAQAPASVRPSFSFAHAAAGKKEAVAGSARSTEPATEAEAEAEKSTDVDAVTEKLAEVNV